MLAVQHFTLIAVDQRFCCLLAQAEQRNQCFNDQWLRLQDRFNVYLLNLIDH